MEKYTIKHPYEGINSTYKEVEIRSDNLYYGELNLSSGGMVRNTKNEDLIHEKCKEVAQLIREIDKLNEENT